MATIKPIEGHSVHQIQSGQVIVDLCSVVKELVENSLDARANSIEIRFKNHGLDSIEVQDNGSGISPDDYETLALKHHTSKLSTYDDLDSLSTFGFRGEALSSLCALSRFHVITALDGDAPKGTKLNFETSGKLKDTEVTASRKGTVVAVEDLFFNLPVRRRELEKNIKREYGKVLNLLHAYACISVNVRFAISNQVAKSPKTVVLSTNSNTSTKENIVNVYGAKTLAGLINLNLEFELQPGFGRNQILSEDIPSNAHESRTVRILGHISRPVFGGGRQTPDRQFFFVNSRPCSLPQIAKAINEVYKSYNVTQSPFIFADLRMDTRSYDVNVSPDKRSILLHDQALLIESLKRSLTDLFEKQEQTIPQSQILASKPPAYKPPTPRRRASNSSELTDHSDFQTPQESSLITLPSEDSFFTEPTGSSVASPDLGSSRGALEMLVDPKSTERPSHRNLPSIRENVTQSTPKPDDSTQKLKKDVREGRADPDDTESVVSDNKLVQAQHLPVETQDGNARMTSQKSMRKAKDESDLLPVEEETIPSVHSTPQEISSSIIQSAWDRARPRRVPVDVATITIGNKTSTAIVGTPSTERHRVKSSIDFDSRKSSARSSRIAKRFRSFAAPSAQIEMSDDEDSSDEDVTDINDNATSSDRTSGSLSSRSSQKQTGDSQNFCDEEENQMQENPLTASAQSTMMHGDTDSDDEYVNADEIRRKEERTIADIVHIAERSAVQASKSNLHRAANALKGVSRSDSTVNIESTLSISIGSIRKQVNQLSAMLAVPPSVEKEAVFETSDDCGPTAEERLSLAISKTDFANMDVVGQFNLGFILATRSKPSTHHDHASFNAFASSSDLFIIDQHASDEIYNFSRLSLITTLTPQRLAQPLPLNLTAVEEETIQIHASTLIKNGFLLSFDDSGNSAVGQRCKLLALPTSKDTVFNPRDLEELISSLTDAPEPSLLSSEADVIRPSRVRRMLAMRACRSSIMVGRELTKSQMQRVVRNMGDIERPWNCPHGRPTMRHLASLGDWQGWVEGDGLTEEESVGRMDWNMYITNSLTDSPDDIAEIEEE